MHCTPKIAHLLSYLCDCVRPNYVLAPFLKLARNWGANEQIYYENVVRLRGICPLITVLHSITKIPKQKLLYRNKKHNTR